MMIDDLKERPTALPVRTERETTGATCSVCEARRRVAAVDVR